MPEAICKTTSKSTKIFAHESTFLEKEINTFIQEVCKRRVKITALKTFKTLSRRPAKEINDSLPKPSSPRDRNLETLDQTKRINRIINQSGWTIKEFNKALGDEAEISYVPAKYRHILHEIWDLVGNDKHDNDYEAIMKTYRERVKALK